MTSSDDFKHMIGLSFSDHFCIKILKIMNFLHSLEKVIYLLDYIKVPYRLSLFFLIDDALLEVKKKFSCIIKEFQTNVIFQNKLDVDNWNKLQNFICEHRWSGVLLEKKL